MRYLVFAGDYKIAVTYCHPSPPRLFRSVRKALLSYRMGIETLGISRYFRLSSTATLLFLKPLDLVSQRGVSTGGTAIFRTPVSFLSFLLPAHFEFLYTLRIGFSLKSFFELGYIYFIIPTYTIIVL